MDSHLITLIRNCTIFASLALDDEACCALFTQLAHIDLKTGDTLFQQGDPADCLYILLSGKLCAILSNASGNTKIIGDIKPGETVGELGAFSNEPRSLTVKVTEDSLLLSISSDTFKHLCRQYPAILFETINPLIHRSQHIIQLLSHDEKKKHIAIIPANNDFLLTQFSEKLHALLEQDNQIYLISDALIESTAMTSEKLLALLRKVEKTHHTILYLLRNEETLLFKICWEKIQTLYVVANGSSIPYFSSFAQEKLHDTTNLVTTRRELILVYPENTRPLYTASWLKEANFFLHHQVRIQQEKDFRRLLRFIQGKPNGLVFSGGGAKGWAHIGALKAIIDANIPIDAIGGTSVGAIIGGLYALYENIEQTCDAFEKLVAASRNTLSFKYFCWPAVALFNFKRFTVALQQIFHDATIENLWLPYFCNTCNLASYKEAIHRQGLLWEKIRGSVSIPGMIPPMILNGELHFDGGLVNNLPVNIMRNLLGTESNIIAVELISDEIDHNKYHFPPTLTFQQVLLAKLGLGHHDYKFPPFSDTFVKALLVGSSVKQRENTTSATILISPDTAQFSMLSLKKEEQDALVALGYAKASEKLQGFL